MPAWRPDQIADFVETTLKKFQRDSWTDISLDLQNHIAMSQLLTGKKVGFSSGEQLQWQVQVQNAGTAKNTGLYDTDDPKVVDVLKNAKVPWAFQMANFSYDEREDFLNSGVEQILNLIEVRRHTAMNDLAVLLETNFWEKPANITDQAELLKPFGIRYWVVQSDTTGFNGGNPSTDTTGGAGGISSVTFPNWSNYTFKFTTISKQDLVRKWREAATKTMFMAPNAFPETRQGSETFGYYTTYNVLGTLEELLEQQNDNLGNDVASKDGMTTFRSNPVIWAPYLDNNTTNDPIYGINWSVFHPFFRTGEFFVVNPPVPSPSQHRVRNVFIDNSCNFRCLDRRRLFVGTTGASN
jgi:hypothetical protein